MAMITTSATMTSKERFTRMFEHREADRVPIVDDPWGATIERWRREGMPENVGFRDFFGLDKVSTIGVRVHPGHEAKVLEETEEYKIRTNEWGTTTRQWKHAASTPEFLAFTVTNPDAWARAKARITPSRDFINWDALREWYPVARREGHWIDAGLWFGFDVTHSWIVGTERLLCAIFTDPEWVMDMFGHLLETELALLDMLWAEGYTFDAIKWPDDMGYKNSQFFSIDTYREIPKPFHKRAIDWAHAHGVKAHLHSCGNVNPMIPELIEIGLDALNPLEVKAGMDPVAVKRRYGDKLVLHGGVNAVLWDQPGKIHEEIDRVVPVMKENGGYIFSSDHSVPSTVSLSDFREIVEHARQAGSY